MRVPEGWTEIKEPQLVKLERVGDALTGVLLSLTNEQIKDEQSGEVKAVLTARMELSNGELVKFRPPYILRQKLGRRLIGKELHVVYDHDDESTKEKGNAMKVIRLFVNPGGGIPEPFVATDDDLPPLD